MVMSAREKPSDCADLSLPSLAHILIATSRYTGLAVQQIKAQRLQAGMQPAKVRARQYVAYVARETSQRPWGVIARYINRDTKAAISGHELIAALIRRGDAEVIKATGAITRHAWLLHNAAQDARASA